MKYITTIDFGQLTTEADFIGRWKQTTMKTSMFLISKVMENYQSPFELSYFDVRLPDVVTFCEDFALPCPWKSGWLEAYHRRSRVLRNCGVLALAWNTEIHWNKLRTSMTFSWYMIFRWFPQVVHRRLVPSWLSNIEGMFSMSRYALRNEPISGSINNHLQTARLVILKPKVRWSFCLVVLRTFFSKTTPT